jgi:hypothetical protein
MIALRAESDAWKPGGISYDEASSQLSMLWDDRSRQLTYSYLAGLGIGNKKQERPVQAALTRRIVDAMAVVYSVPALRWLRDAQGPLPEESIGMDSMNGAFRRSMYDLLWQSIDGLRNLYRNAVVEWVEDDASGCVSAFVFGPHQVYRTPDPSNPSAIDRDRTVALMIRAADKPEDQRWRVWERSGDGWNVYLVDGLGAEVGAQPYGGRSPFGGLLPLQVIYDEHPLGQAWLPIPESRVDWALSLNGMLNDLALLVQLEAHSPKSIKTGGSSRKGLPTAVGPDQVVVIEDADGEFKVHSQQPKIAESIAAIEQQLGLWALGEYLSPDEFKASTVPQTALALRTKERALEKRRRRQIQLAPAQEQGAWLRYSRVHNTFARRWGVEILPEAAELSVQCGRTWQPSDPKELQDYLFKQLAAGFKSRVDVLMELDGLTRQQAIEQLERVRLDRLRFPLEEYQAPGSLTEVHGTLGEGSSTKSPGQFNPELTTSSEGASVIDAVVRAAS